MSQPPQDPYGRDPYGQDPYGRDPYGRDPYGLSPTAEPPYGQPPYAPQGHPPPGMTPDGRRLATFGRRLGGYLLDSLVVSLPSFVLVGIVVVAIVASIDTTTNADGTTDVSGVSIGLILGLYGLLFLYGIGIFVLQAELVHRRGQTFGMRWVGLKVIDGKTGGGVSRGKAYGRAAFASFISGQLFAIGYLWPLWDERRRTLHDLVCDTLVVET